MEENQKEIIQKTAEFVKSRLLGEGSGHDWWHIYRVWKNAIHIAQRENANLFVVELAALLHDIADWKFHNGDIEMGAQVSFQWLSSLQVEKNIILHVCQIVRDISFKGAGVQQSMPSIEGEIVQDADRLDAIGAIGIARTFAYGGSRNREMYNPDIHPCLHASFDEYKNSRGTTINHFYEKLLLLKDRMNTSTGRNLAEKRHEIMESFLQEFMNEWDGK